jgi:hypothetical protein
MDQLILAALEECGVDWRIENGKKHRKLIVGRRLAGVLPHGHHSEVDRRSVLNTVRQIRQVARETAR